MDFIKIYDNVLSEEQCSHYINLIENGRQYPGKVADPKNAYNPNAKVSLDVNISQDYPEEVEYLIKLVEGLVGDYSEDCNAVIPMVSCELFTGRKYEEGKGFYRQHMDAGNAYTITRTITVLIYLNSVEGGEVEFPLQNRKINPAPGRVVMFPSAWTHPHIAHKTTKGDRYIMRTFILACN